MVALQTDISYRRPRNLQRGKGNSPAQDIMKKLLLVLLIGIALQARGARVLCDGALQFGPIQVQDITDFGEGVTNEVRDISSIRVNDVYVSVSGSDTTGDGTFLFPWASIRHALTNITVSSFLNPYEVHVGSGAYFELPLNVPESVNVIADSVSDRTLVIAIDPNTDLFTCTGRSGLFGLFINGVTNASAIRYDGDAIFVADNIIALDCLNGITISNALAVVKLTDFSLANTTAAMNCGVNVLAGSVLIDHLALGPQSTAPIDCLIYGTGSNSFIQANDTTVINTNLVNGIKIENGADGIITGGRIEGTAFDNIGAGIYCDNGTLSLKAVSIRYADNGMVITNNADLTIGNTSVRDSDWHLVKSSDSTINGFGEFDISKIDKLNGNSTVAYISRTEGDRGLIVDGEMQVVGEFTAGEGDSNVQGMKCFWNTSLSTGTWTDVTTTFASATLSETNAFPSTNVNACLFIGADRFFPGIKGIVTELAAEGSDIVSEFWDGSNWTNLINMVRDDATPYAQYGNVPFEFSLTNQTYFGDATGWTTNTLNSENKYWVRFRNNSAIVTNPALQQIKLSVRKVEVDPFGVLSYHGDETPTRLITGTGWAEYIPILGDAPASESVVVSANQTLQYTLNRFRVVAGTYGKGILFNVPDGLDTSKPLTFTYRFAPTSDEVSGDVDFDLYRSIIKEGDVLDGTATETLITEATTIGTSTAEQVYEVSFSFTEPALIPGDQVVLSIKRTGSTDTYDGEVYMISAEGDGKFWR